jgi:hypothetical protein
MSLRIAYMPTVSARNIQAAPSYQWFRAFRRSVLQAEPDAVFYAIVPKVEEGSGWKVGADWSGDRTHVVEVPAYRSQFDELQLVTRDVWEMFNERFGTHYFDVFLHERPQLNPLLQRLMSFHIEEKSRKPLVVARDQFTVDSTIQHADETDELLEVLGWSSAPTIFQSPHQARRAASIARRHVQGHHTRRIIERSKVFPLGIDCSDVDATNMAERDQKLERVTISYSAKLFNANKFVESLEIMDSVFAGGRPVGMQVVTGSAASKLAMVKRAQKFQYFDVYGQANRTTFLKQTARAHILISNSPYEDFSATICEMLYTGLIPVLPAADWARYLLPSDYPLLFSSKAEGNAMLRYAVDNYEALAAEWVPLVQQKIAEQFDLRVVAAEMLAWMTAQRVGRVARLRANTQALRGVIEEAYAVLPDEFGEPDVYAAIKKVSKSLDPLREAESMSTSKWLCLDLLRAAHPELVDLGTEQVTWKKT